MQDNRSLAPSSQGAQAKPAVPQAPDTSLAFLSKDPHMVGETIKQLAARRSYLRQFIEKGYSEYSLPQGGPGIPADQELVNVESALRSLYGLQAFLSQGRDLVPVDQFPAVAAVYDSEGRPKDVIRNAVSQIPDEAARRNLANVLTQAGAALAFQRDLLAFSGAKRVRQLTPKDPDGAFDSVSTKLYGLYERFTQGLEPSGTVKEGELASARESASWSAIQEQMFRTLTEAGVLTVVTPQQPGQRPQERIAQLSSELSQLNAKLQSGQFTPDELKRAARIQGEIMRLEGRARS